MRKLSLVTAVSSAIFLILASPDSSAKTSFGGIIFLDSYGVDRNSANNSGGRLPGAAATADSFSSGRIELPNITRLRASWSNEDDVGMFIELGIGGASGATSVSTRQAYGTYRISDRWQILAGHTTSPFSPLFPNQLLGNNAPTSASRAQPAVGGGHNTGKGYGDFDGGRNPQLRFTYLLPSQNGAIAIAFLDPNQGASLSLPGEFSTPPQREGFLPRVDVGGAFAFYNFRVFPGFSYQHQSYNGVASPAEDSVTTWAASLALQTGRGPFEISGEFNFGQNWKNSSYSLGNSAASLRGGAIVAAQINNSDINDSDNYSYWIDAGWKMTTKNTSNTLHFVYGQMQSDPDGAIISANQGRVRSTMYGISWPIELPWIARGMTIRPEAFVYDEGSLAGASGKVDFGREIIAGVQLQYTF
jgi:hypothetical protein